MTDDLVRCKLRYGPAAIDAATKAALVIIPVGNDTTVCTIVGERADLVRCIDDMVEMLFEHGLGAELERAVAGARPHQPAEGIEG